MFFERGWLISSDFKFITISFFTFQVTWFSTFLQEKEPFSLFLHMSDIINYQLALLSIGELWEGKACKSSWLWVCSRGSFVWLQAFFIFFFIINSKKNCTISVLNRSICNELLKQSKRFKDLLFSPSFQSFWSFRETSLPEAVQAHGNHQFASWILLIQDR